jgi:uncharacterized protein YjhX (UPF0386 family)
MPLSRTQKLSVAHILAQLAELASYRDMDSTIVAVRMICRDTGVSREEVAAHTSGELYEHLFK